MTCLSCAHVVETHPPSHQTVMTYQNPVWNHDFPDPFLVFDGKMYYAYATQKDDSGFQLLASKDMVHWEPQPAVFKPTWADTHYWAPEVYHRGSRWYFLYSAKDRITGKRDIAIAAGPTPRGPFTDLGKLVLGQDRHPDPHDENGAIDGTLYFAGNTPYLLYSQEVPRSIIIQELTPDLSKPVGAGQILITPDRPKERGVVEAPTLIKHGGKFWLFYSSGWFQSSKADACYEVSVAHANELKGPYVKSETPLIFSVPGHIYSPGHQSILEMAGDDWWVAYHAWDAAAEPLYGSNPTGRTLRIDRMKWTDHGPELIGPTWTPQPLLPSHRVGG